MNPVEIIISSEEYIQAIEKVGSVFKLHIDQIGELNAETNMLLLGRTASRKYVGNLEKRLEVDKTTAEMIAREIDLNVIKNIKHLLVNNADFQESEMLRAEEETEEYHATLKKEDLLNEIEDPQSDYHKVIISSTEEPKEISKEVVQEAIEEAHAHTYIVPEPTHQIDIKKIEDNSHLISASREGVTRIPGEKIELKAKEIIKEVPKKQEVIEVAKEEATVVKKRPLSEIIPPNVPRNYNIDPYREPIE